MKVRSSFVSNSSSSSFVLRKSVLTDEQTQEVKDFLERWDDWCETGYEETDEWFQGFLECHGSVETENGDSLNISETFCEMVESYPNVTNKDFGTEYCGCEDEIKERLCK